MKLLFVFGTRPEAIKMAPVIHEASRLGDRVACRVCVTAQHREMLDQVLALFGIAPDHDLEVMEDNQTPTQVAAAVLERLEPVLRAERPDWVLVQGDTTSAAAAAIAAFYARSRVAHVEAGLRTRDRWQPFPEEINRRIVSAIAELHLAPTERSRDNLLREGTDAGRILVTGNTVIDALRWVAARDTIGEAAVALPSGAQLVFMTAHRRENFGAPLENICRAVAEVARARNGRVHFLYPVHPNPMVREPVHRLLGNLGGVTLTPPLDYGTTVAALKRARLVLTDSGGLQEEAPGLGVPVLVLREVTERPEAVEAGTARIVGTDPERIVREMNRLLDDDAEHGKMARAVNPFGDGHASERILAALLGERVEPFRVATT